MQRSGMQCSAFVPERPHLFGAPVPALRSTVKCRVMVPCSACQLLFQLEMSEQDGLIFNTFQFWAWVDQWRCELYSSSCQAASKYSQNLRGDPAQVLQLWGTVEPQVNLGPLITR